MEDALRYLEAGAEVLEDYLLSSHLFWDISSTASKGRRKLPNLTMGGLLLAWKLAQAGARTTEQVARFERASAKVEAVHRRWQVAWENKCRQSFLNRLNMWRNFIEEYRDQPEENADRFAYEVRWRAMLHLLQAEGQPIEPAVLNLLEMMDKILRHVLRPGPFVWQEELSGGFPQEEYWFLYGQLPRELN